MLIKAFLAYTYISRLFSNYDLVINKWNEICHKIVLTLKKQTFVVDISFCISFDISEANTVLFDISFSHLSLVFKFVLIFHHFPSRLLNAFN